MHVWEVKVLCADERISSLLSWQRQPQAGPSIPERFSLLLSPNTHMRLPNIHSSKSRPFKHTPSRECPQYGAILYTAFSYHANHFALVHAPPTILNMCDVLTRETKSECRMMVLMKKRWSVTACPAATLADPRYRCMRWFWQGRALMSKLLSLLISSWNARAGSRWR